MKKEIRKKFNICIAVHSALLLLIIILIPLPVMAARNVSENEWILSYSGGVEGEVIVSATREIYNIGSPYEINPDAKVSLRAPKVTLTSGFYAAKGSKVFIGTPVFNLHFVVLSADADFPDHDGITSTCGSTEGCCPKRGPGFHCIVKKDIELLLESINNNFISEDGDQIVRFRLGGFTAYSDLTDADKDDPLYESITNTNSDGIWLWNNYSGRNNDTNFNACTKNRLCDHSAINVYIYENRYYDEGSYMAIDNDSGHGRNNNHRPFILVDFDRVTGIDIITGMPILSQRPFVHELGHAFNLGHVCQADQALPGFNTNIMSSKAYCEGLEEIPCDSMNSRRGGNREGGFAYNSLQNCPVSSQDWWADNYDPVMGCPEPYQSWCDDFLPDDDDGISLNQLGQIEIIYWNSVLMQENLTPNYPF